MVGKAKYIPGRGDLVMINFNPQVGHEQAGRRPALVLSPKRYNEVSSLGLFCPITSKIKGYPFELGIKHQKISGVLLADQVKSFDWSKRQIEFISKVSDEVLVEVQKLLAYLIMKDY